MESKGSDIKWNDLTPDEKDLITRAREIAYQQREMAKLCSRIQGHLRGDHYLVDATGSMLPAGGINIISIEIGKMDKVSVKWLVEFAGDKFDDVLDESYKWLRETFDFPHDVR